MPKGPPDVADSNGLRLAGAVVLVPKSPLGVEKGTADSGELWLAGVVVLAPKAPQGLEKGFRN